MMSSRCFFFSVAWLTCGIAGAGTVELVASKDTSLFEEQPTFSNGAGQHLFAGRIAPRGGGTIRRALIAFDIAGFIPEGSTIDSAELTLNMSRTIAGDQTVSLHRVTTDWGESTSNAIGSEGRGIAAADGDATWEKSVVPDNDWTTSGGDFVEMASDSQTVGRRTGAVTWSSDAMVADVQTWLDSTEMNLNLGWILIGNEDSMQTAKRFDSRENPRESNRPLLSVEFTVGIDALTAEVVAGTNNPLFDLNDDTLVNEEDRRVWVEEIKNTYFGDSTLDGEFNTSDLVQVFQAGEYQDAAVGNSLWGTGDWNGDLDFTSSDIVRAFQAGGFELGPRAATSAVPEPSGALISLTGLLAFLIRGRCSP